jgi:hypothetical protein
MSWNIVVVEKDTGYDRNPGEAFYAPWLLQTPHTWLSKQYMEQWRDKRPPIVVVLPMRVGDATIGFHFCVDGPASSSPAVEGGFRDGWTVTGELPNITVSPSINCHGAYHGWIQNGVISDDCEGRKFP